jgi:hypothetical protein
LAEIGMLKMGFNPSENKCVHGLTKWCRFCHILKLKGGEVTQ